MALFKRKPVHVHTWETTGASFNKSRSGWHAKNISATMLRELTYGVTVMTQRCTECGYVDTTRHVGRISIPGMKWKDSV